MGDGEANWEIEEEERPASVRAFLAACANVAMIAPAALVLGALLAIHGLRDALRRCRL